MQLRASYQLTSPAQRELITGWNFTRKQRLCVTWKKTQLSWLLSMLSFCSAPSLHMCCNRQNRCETSNRWQQLQKAKLSSQFSSTAAIFWRFCLTFLENVVKHIQKRLYSMVFSILAMFVFLHACRCLKRKTKWLRGSSTDCLKPHHFYHISLTSTTCIASLSPWGMPWSSWSSE